MIEFLSRWSRRKRDVAHDAGEIVEAADVVGTGEAAVPADARPLPELDELTADADFTAFLRPEVPPVMRNAALRRLWRLDPAIRDFEGPARDYAYDWNTPGGVPGGGPLGSSTDVGAMVAAVLGPRPTSATPSEAGEPAAPEPRATGEETQEAIRCEPASS